MTYQECDAYCQQKIEPGILRTGNSLKYVQGQLRDTYGGGPAIWESFRIVFGSGVIPETLCDLDGDAIEVSRRVVSLST